MVNDPRGLIVANLSSAGAATQAKLGCMYKVLLFNPAGHYTLDLSDPKQRDILIRLGEINLEDREYLRIRCVSGTHNVMSLLWLVFTTLAQVQQH